jgi:cell wall-associated NlpC family hydrolase
VSFGVSAVGARSSAREVGTGRDGGGRHRKARAGLRPLTAVARRMTVASSLALTLVVTGLTPAFAAPVAPLPATVSCVTTPPTAPAVVAATGSAPGIYGGVLLTGRQVDAAATIVNVGLDAGITRRGIAVAVAAAMHSSSLHPAARNGLHIGLFQQRSDPSSGLYTAEDRADAVGSARMFYAELVKRVPGYDTDARSAAELADVVQESGDVARLATWSGLADGLVNHFVPVEAPTVPTEPTEPTVPVEPPAAAVAPVAVRTPGPAGSIGQMLPLPLRTPGVALAAPASSPGTAESPTTQPTTSSTTASSVAADPAPSASPVQPSTGPGTDRATADPSTTDPGTTTPEPTTTAPADATTDPATTDPATTDPATTDPATTDPATTDPATTDPATTDPTTTEPATTEPATDPTTTDPVPSVPLPPVVEPTVVAPPVVEPPVVDTPQLPDTEPEPVRSSDPVVRTGDVPAVPDCGPNNNGGSTVFDPGFIISDEVFYDTQAMTAEQIQAFLDTHGAACEGPSCVRNLRVTTPDVPADQYCAAYSGGTDELASAVLARASAACGINPQVMLVTLQKESALVTKTSVAPSSYNAAWGWHCPDSGPGGSANCDPKYAGFFNQLFGMAKQWSRYKVDPGKYHYQAGETETILWNVAETGCGGTEVTIRNTATASLYNYTPYQPNAAALASYPGVGDRCSAYGNRNFFFLFQKYFGVTGGGVSAAIAVNGVQVTIPDLPSVAPEVRGAVVTAPNEDVARGIAAGFASIGLPYVWGGGTNGGQADQGCSRGGSSKNSCSGTVGFDCSGLTAYVLTTAGFAVGSNSGSQRAGGQSVPWSAGQAGDIIGYSGHVAIYLGKINGVDYLLESPNVGRHVQIRAVYGRTSGSSADSMLHRYWA